MLDTALKLKIDIDKGVKISTEQALQSLTQSQLVTQLTADIIERPLYYVWRIIALSEIPYAEYLSYTRNLIERLYAGMATPFGFSLSGDESMFLPCYNAMLVSALCRLGRAKDTEVKNAVDWINTHQPMNRGKELSLPGFKFDRYGGCFRSTPCYIGLAKSVIALDYYKEKTGEKTFDQKLEEGKQYLLKHQLIYRLNADQPITGHILNISFPETYHLNIVELIRFAARTNLLADKRTNKAVEILENARTKNEGWKINFRYKADGYMVFDTGRKDADWLTYILNKALTPSGSLKDDKI